MRDPGVGDAVRRRAGVEVAGDVVEIRDPRIAGLGQADEDQPVGHAHLAGVQPEGGLVEVLPHAARADQAAFEVVDPGVVGAGQRLPDPAAAVEQIRLPRWRQTLKKARTSPSEPRTRMIDSSPTS